MDYISIVLTIILCILVAEFIYNYKRSRKKCPSNYINPNDSMGIDYGTYGPPGYNSDVDKIEVLILKHSRYPITVNLKQDVEGILIFEITDTFSEN